ncbi:MAG: carbohydrate ABC transporter permease [Lachnospiraceae bacterium]|nr:carbohydrate ABC transporter permease [Lachnospiraceae bacterium]
MAETIVAADAAQNAGSIPLGSSGENVDEIPSVNIPEENEGSLLDKIRALREDKQFENTRIRWMNRLKSLVLWIFRTVMIVGISYVIIGPLISIISSSFFSDSDLYNNMVFVIPQNPTLERYINAFSYMSYPKVFVKTILYTLSLMVLNVLVCSMVGYGFARFEFPFKKLFFGMVVVMIVIPIHTILFPLYITFHNFNPLWIPQLATGQKLNLLGTYIPMYIMTLFGTGLRSGLYIYIFIQFFRGLPKEIEEAAFVDGAGMFYTYFRIMLRNAMPAVVTVAIFSIVWQYNDTSYARMFNFPSDAVLSIRISSLSDTISNAMSISDPNITALFNNAGIVLVILPVMILYIVLQKQFVEGVERSGIVG